MQPQEQAKIIVARYRHLLHDVAPIHEDNLGKFIFIATIAKECGIFLAEQAQKTADIRGFNYWADVIEEIQAL